MDLASAAPVELEVLDLGGGSSEPSVGTLPAGRTAVNLPVGDLAGWLPGARARRRTRERPALMTPAGA